MSTKDENKYPFEIIKEKLLSEKSFIEFCKYDYSRTEKINNVDESFLRAAESDGFLEPLLQVKEKVHENGAEKGALVNYYSPHQIFIITALSKNQVHEGKLWVNEDLDFYKQQAFRMVSWGASGFAFNITIAKRGSKSFPNNVVDLCVNFNNFLRLLHSLKSSRYQRFSRYKERHFNGAPELYFDTSLIKGRPELLKKYSLSESDLNVLLKTIAEVAIQIDPLENWYYYIHLHPQWRRDLFKGGAMLAQELYTVYDLVLEVAEAVFGKKLPPIFELLYGDRGIRPYLAPKSEYVHGTETKSIWATVLGFKIWAAKADNKEFADDEVQTRIKGFEEELKDYEKRYGDMHFIANGVRPIELEESLTIDDLDPNTKLSVEQVLRQATKELAENKRGFLSLWDDEIWQKLQKKEITSEEAKKEDYELFVKSEIHNAIDFRLSDLKRELWEILEVCHKKIREKENKAWDEEHNFGNFFWSKRSEKLKTLTREKQLDFYNKEYQKVHKNAQHWQNKGAELSDIEFQMELLFCRVCRAKPVIRHQQHGDSQVSDTPICDECLARIESGALDIGQDWSKIKVGEWKCDFCGERTLYKFAHNNVVSLWTANQIPIKVKLNYGNLTLSARCPRCKNINYREIDWGWGA